MVVVVVTGVDIQALAAAQELIIQEAVVLHIINDIAAVIDNFHTEKSLIGTDSLLGFHRPDRVIVGDNIAVVLGSLNEFVDILGGVFSGTIGAGFRYSGKLLRWHKFTVAGVAADQGGILRISGKQIHMNLRLISVIAPGGIGADMGLIAGEHEKIRL